MKDRERHPSRAALSSFLRSEASGGTERTIRSHLQDGCVRCVLEVRRLRREMVSTPGRLRFREGERAAAWVERWADQIERQSFLVRAEARVGEELLAELLLFPPEERRAQIHARERYRLHGLAETLSRRAREECFLDVGRAVELGELAVEVAESLDPRLYPEGSVSDAAALAWGALGNAHRVRANLPSSRRCLTVAQRLLSRGTGDPIVRAEILSLFGSLYIDLALYEDAVRILEQAVAEGATDKASAFRVKALLKLALASREAGAADRAVQFLGQAEQLIDPSEDPGLYYNVLHSKTLALLDLDRVREAAELYADLRPAYERVIPGFRARQRLDWLGAKVAWARGDLERAETELDTIRRASAEHEEDYLFALVTLDLAALYLEQGRTAEVRRLAEEMLPVFTSRQIHQHALAALVLFERAAAAETANVALVRELVTYLRRARNNPGLPFRSETDRGGAG